MEVTTLNKGNIPMSSVEVGDYVLTSDNTFKPLLKKSKQDNPSGKKIRFAFLGQSYLLSCPDDCKILTLIEDNPIWVKISDLKVGDYCYIPINNEEYDKVEFTYIKHLNQVVTKEMYATLDDLDWWWCVGYYLGDGWYQKRRKRNGKWQRSTRMTLGCNANQCDYIAGRFSKFFKCNIQKDKRKIVFSNSCFYNFVKVLGDNALEKHLPYDFTKYPKDILAALIEGYIFADGHREENFISCNSISKELMFQVFIALIKIYGTLPMMGFVKTADTTEIEGRIVNQRDYWSVKINLAKSKVYFEKELDGFWIKVREIEEISVLENFFNYDFGCDVGFALNGVAVKP
ncbi:MAG: hypothetical protein IJF83_12005 [Methanobrevibacter sp.]|nr:hypothetical protein [Methanobrevibacter sp.]